MDRALAICIRNRTSRLRRRWDIINSAAGYLTYSDGAFGVGFPVAVVLFVSGGNVGDAADANVGAAAVGDDKAVGKGRRRRIGRGQPR